MAAFVTVCAGALLFAVCALLLREFGFRGTTVFTVLCTAVLLLSYMDRIAEPIRALLQMLSLCDVGEAMTDILRILGIGTLASVAADTCRDFGEERMAAAVTSVGKAEILLVVFPYFSEAIATGLSFFGE